MGGGRRGGGGGGGVEGCFFEECLYLLVCARVGACFWKGARVNITVVKFWYFV